MRMIQNITDVIYQKNPQNYHLYLSDNLTSLRISMKMNKEMKLAGSHLGG